MEKEYKVEGTIFTTEEMRGILKYLNVVVAKIGEADTVNVSGFKDDITNLNELLNG